ncbi:MAG: hypothetical protein PVF54_09900 [Anaerolineae bacterium]
MEESTWILQPGASLQSLLDEPTCPPPLRRALASTYSWQARNETTVGRTLEASRLAPQFVAALLALGASVTVGGEDGRRQVPLEVSVKRQVQGEVGELRVPCLAPGYRWGEARVARAPSDEPIVAAYAVVGMRDGIVQSARVALTGVSSGPVRLVDAPEALVGGPLTEAGIRRVAASVEEEVEPDGNYKGSRVYRRAMAGVLTRRALQACLEQEVGDAE